LVKETGLFDEVLSVDKHLVVLLQGFLEGTPDRDLGGIKNVSQFLPVEAGYKLLLLSTLLFSFSSVFLLIGAGHCLLDRLTLALLFKCIEGFHNVVRVKVKVIRIHLFFRSGSTTLETLVGGLFIQILFGVDDGDSELIVFAKFSNPL